MAEATHSDAAFSLLRANLGYYGELPEEIALYLRSLLDYAFVRLRETCGVNLMPGTLYDDQLQVMYAAWLYRKGGEGAEKPPMLKEAIRDYQLSKALSSGGSES